MKLSYNHTYVPAHLHNTGILMIDLRCENSIVINIEELFLLNDMKYWQVCIFKHGFETFGNKWSLLSIMGFVMAYELNKRNSQHMRDSPS